MSFRTTADSRRLVGLATCVGVSQLMLKARGAKRMRDSQGLGMRSSASDVVTRAAWTKRALRRSVHSKEGGGGSRTDQVPPSRFCHRFLRGPTRFWLQSIFPRYPAPALDPVRPHAPL